MTLRATGILYSTPFQSIFPMTSSISSLTPKVTPINQAHFFSSIESIASTIYDPKVTLPCTALRVTAAKKQSHRSLRTKQVLFFDTIEPTI
jgi:hypothetical protein